MTAKTAAYITLSKGENTNQMVFIPRLSDGNAYLLGRIVSDATLRRLWRIRSIDADTPISSVTGPHLDSPLNQGWVSTSRPKFATVSAADEEAVLNMNVPGDLLRRISGALSLPGTPLPEDFSDRRFETIIDGIPQGSMFVSWLLEQDAE